MTRKDVHARNMTALIERLEARGEDGRFLCVAGGPRITNTLAIELGYDHGVGRGACDVARLIAWRSVERARAM